jgi:transposase InsO family protein
VSENDPGINSPARDRQRPHVQNRTELLDRNLAADRPKQKWVGDISDTWTREGWLSLAFAIVFRPIVENGSFLNLYSRRVIGWAGATA